MPSYVLDLNDLTALSAIFQAVDGRLTQIFNAPPNGMQAAAFPGIWGFDTQNSTLWLAIEADGTIEGTVWVQQFFELPVASETTAGISELATVAETQTGTDDTRVVHAYGAAQTYAKKGANSDITSLTGLTTPLAETYGGSGSTDFDASVIAALPSMTGHADQFLSNNGASLAWARLREQSMIVSSDSNVTAGTSILVTAAGKTLTLPSTPSPGDYVLITVKNFTNTVVSRNGNKIMGLDENLTIDVENSSLRLQYFDATNGWWLVQRS